MFYWIVFVLFPLLSIANPIEVFLPTRASTALVYLSGFKGGDFEDMRSLLEADLNLSGFVSVAPRSEFLEEAIGQPFNGSIWRKERVAFCLSAQVIRDRLEITVFNIEQGTRKKYSAIPLERQAIHKLADAIQKDLFGVEGISSLKLIYTVRTKNQTPKGLKWLSEVWICDSDGKNATQLTREQSYCLSPFFIPDSTTEFFYVSEKSGQSKIYRASISNPKGNLMVDLRGNQALAAMKGSKIAFITDIAGRPDLFVQSLDAAGRLAGKPRQLFSAPRATQASPTFSPDGNKIAFVSDKDGPPRIYMLDIADANRSKRAQPQLLTKKNRENTSPSWSPDGKKLAYSAKVDDVRQIWIYDFLTGEETALTTGPENKENPSWAPNSFHLVYNTENEDQSELYLIHLNHAEPIYIGKGRFASWSSRN